MVLAVLTYGQAGVSLLSIAATLVPSPGSAGLADGLYRFALRCSVGAVITGAASTALAAITYRKDGQRDGQAGGKAVLALALEGKSAAAALLALVLSFTFYRSNEVENERIAARARAAAPPPGGQSGP